MAGRPVRFGAVRASLRRRRRNILPVKRDRRDRHFRRALDRSAAEGDVDQRVVRRIVDPTHRELLEDEALLLREDFLAALAPIDIADRDRPGLAAGDRRVRGVFKPVSFRRAIPEPAVEIAEMTGDAGDFRVLQRFKLDLVADEVVLELTNLFVLAGPQAASARAESEMISVRIADTWATPAENSI